MFSRAAIVALTLILAPLAARAADLVVWWEEGWYAEENDAVKELIATFEAAAAKEVELRLQPASEQSVAAQAAIDAGAPPDFLFGIWVQHRIEQWAFNSRLVDLTDAVQPLLGLFDADALEGSAVGTYGDLLVRWWPLSAASAPHREAAVAAEINPENQSKTTTRHVAGGAGLSGPYRTERFDPGSRRLSAALSNPARSGRL